MSEEQINVAIAEACGWTDISQYTQAVDGWYGYEPENGPHSQIPNFCNDLNAMHEAEKMLGEVHSIKSCEYDDWLQSTIEHDQKWRATARQRAEAFLRTIGKWEETK